MMNSLEITFSLLHSPEKFKKYVPKTDKNRNRLNQLLSWLLFILNLFLNILVIAKRNEKKNITPVESMPIQFPELMSIDHVIREHKMVMEHASIQEIHLENTIHV